MNKHRSNSNAFYDKFARTPETINGVTKTRGEWCDERGVAYATAYYKMRDGLSFDEAARSSRATSWRRTLVTIGGETLEAGEWCRRYCIGPDTVYRRIMRGMDMATAITTPVGEDWIADKVMVTIGGVTRTLKEWARLKGRRSSKVTEIYKRTGDAEYALMSFDERRAVRLRRAAETVSELNNEYNLSRYPTQEVLDMCEHCPHADCVSSIRKCLAIKRAKEEEND